MSSTSDRPTLADPRRFSVPLPRALWIGIVAVVLVVVALGLQIGVPIYRQQVAIREIERVGGYVTLGSRGPEWLRDWLGFGGKWVEFVDPPIAVYLMGSSADDATLVHLRAIRTLEQVALNTQVTDAGLSHLKGLDHLEVLRLDGTQVTDAGMIHLKGLKSLNQLGLCSTRITDAGLLQISGLPKLNFLSLDNTQVTDAGLVH